MSESRSFDDATGLALVERLAAGDLPEDARRDLFAWLEEDVSRWRRCALSLLEAREIELAFDDWGVDLACQPAVVSRPPVEPAGAPRNGRWRSFLMVLSVLLAFGLGVVAEGWRQGNERQVAQAPAGNRDLEQPDIPRNPKPFADRQEADREEMAPENRRAQDLIVAGSRGAGNELLAPYDRSQWEKQGYLVTESHDVVSVSLPNGQQVQVPVDQVQVKYIGQRVY